MTGARLWSGVGLAFVLALSVAGCRQDSSASGAVAERSADGDAYRLVAQGAWLLDVRTPQEFASGHINGAINIPVDQLGARLDELGERDRPVVVYCRSGHRSGIAAKILRKAGFAVTDVGPMTAWRPPPDQPRLCARPGDCASGATAAHSAM